MKKKLDIVIFGGTGDLSLRKLMPSLYLLYEKGHLPEVTRILGVATKDLSKDDFSSKVLHHLELNLGSHFNKKQAESFIELLDYKSIDLKKSLSWNKLEDWFAQGNPSKIIYYMAVPPTLFGVICSQLKTKNLNFSSSSLVVEKPLGEDLKSAGLVNDILVDAFTEEQIYRIDHYLGKSSFHNIMAFRFSNPLIEAIWSHEYIESIQITVAETIGVEDRAIYLDKAGILRDMVQNHLIQILSCLALEKPLSLKADDIRDEKVRVVKSLRPITVDNIKEMVVRAQYEAGEGHKGYLDDIKGTDTKGTGETFVALKALIDNDRWRNVPFYLRTGKRMQKQFAQIVVNLKPLSPNLFNVPNNSRIIFNIQPDTTISCDLYMHKIVNDQVQIAQSNYSSSMEDGKPVLMTLAYEKLLKDVILGDQSCFVREDEINASWQWIDGIRDAWNASGLEICGYPSGSMGPNESDELLKSQGHKWDNEVLS